MAHLEEKKRAILEALVLALIPLAKLCLQNSLRLGELREAVKLAFIKAAEQQVKEVQETPSVSRLSIMTGVNRRDVTRLLKEDLDVTRFPDLTSRVLGTWQSDKRFMTSAGKPRVLAVEGRESEFSELVRSVSSDVAPYTVLHEFERLGLVERTKTGIKMCATIYVNPPENLEEGFRMLGEDARDLIYAVEENISERNDVPNLHLKTEYSRISQKDMPAIRDWLLCEGSRYHRKVREYLAQYDIELNPELQRETRGARVAYVSYSFVEGMNSSQGKQEHE